MLFIPALKHQFIDKALASPARAFILDLEDSIGADHKEAAREALSGSVARLRADTRPVLVRVNAGDQHDLAAAASLHVDGIVLPKVEDAQDVALAATFVASTEIALLATIETPKGLKNISAIAGHIRVAALLFGAGDFIATTGIAARDDLLIIPALMVNFAAKAAGLPVFGLPGTIAEMKDLDRLAALARAAKALGYAGAPAIHPSQLPALEAGFSPSAEEINAARMIVAAYEASDGSAFVHGGVLIERGIYDMSRALIASI